MITIRNSWVNAVGLEAASKQADREAAAILARLAPQTSVTLSVDIMVEYILSTGRDVNQSVVGVMEMLGLSANSAARIAEAYSVAAGKPTQVRSETTSRVVSGARSGTPYYFAGLAIALATFKAALSGVKDGAAKDAENLYVAFCERVVS